MHPRLFFRGGGSQCKGRYIVLQIYLQVLASAWFWHGMACYWNGKARFWPDYIVASTPTSASAQLAPCETVQEACSAVPGAWYFSYQWLLL